MTRKQFEARAICTAEKALGVPAGWWGKYGDVTNGRVRVYGSRNGGWKIAGLHGKVVSRHDSRSFAIKKAAKL